MKIKRHCTSKICHRSRSKMQMWLQLKTYAYLIAGHAATSSSSSTSSSSTSPPPSSNLHRGVTCKLPSHSSLSFNLLNTSTSVMSRSCFRLGWKAKQGATLATWNVKSEYNMGTFWKKLEKWLRQHTHTLDSKLLMSLQKFKRQNIFRKVL